MKKILLLLVVALLVVNVVFAGGSSENDKPVIGAIWYHFGDTFIANARTTLNNLVENEGTFEIKEADSMGDVATQTNNLSNFYTQGVDYMVLNNINFNAIGSLVEQAKENDTPLIIANSDSPTEEEFAIYEHVYHVSAAEEESGRIMGEQLSEYWFENPSADRNGNGKMDYVMLLGLTQHSSTQIRSKYSVDTIKANGIEVSLLQEEIAEYQRAIAQNALASIIQAKGDDIEAIIACNDDMALGAIEALKAAGYFTSEDTFIPVVSVDATATGVAAVEEGTLLGTAFNNSKKLSESIYSLVKVLESGKELNNENIGIDGVDVVDKHIYIDFIGIQADNVADAK